MWPQAWLDNLYYDSTSVTICNFCGNHLAIYNDFGHEYWLQRMVPKPCANNMQKGQSAH